MPLLLGACAGSLFQTKAAPPTEYLLSAPDVPKAVEDKPLSDAPPIPADLSVLKPLVRTGLNNDRIAALYPDRRLDYFEAAHWSGPLDEVIQDLLVRELRLHAGLRNVSAEASAFASSYWLEIEVTDFQAEYAGPDASPTAHVRIEARIGNSADRRILARFGAEVEITAAQNRMAAIVDAYNRAADQAFERIVADTAQTLRANAAKN